MQHERIPRPDEVIGYRGELAEDKTPDPVRCSAGRSSDNRCPRPATLWMYGDHSWARCEEHARALDLSHESEERDLAVEVAEDWLSIARAWENDGLERGVDAMLRELRREALRANARADLALEIANAPRASLRPDAPELPPDQEEPAEEADVLAAVKSLLSEASQLLSGSWPETEADEEVGVRAKHAIAEAARIIIAEQRLRREQGDEAASEAPESDAGPAGA